MKMEYVLQNTWLTKVVVFFAIIGVIKTIEFFTDKELLDKQNFISLIVITVAVQVFGMMTK